MNEENNKTPEVAVPPAPVQQGPAGDVPQNRGSSAGAWIGGLLLALAAGAVMNVVAGLMSMGLHETFLGFLLGATPGMIFGVPALLVANKRASFAGMPGGLCVGGCIIALIGGACGASMVGTTFGK